MSIKIRAAAITVATSLVAVPLALSGTAFAQDQPTGYIGGIVFNDLNGDGVQQNGEPGIPNVDVMVKGPDGQAHPFPTSNDGIWNLKRAPYGQYEISYVDPKLGNTTPSTVKAEIKEGDTPGVNFGVRGGSICGVAWTDANEDGTRQAGEGPLAGRLISLETTTNGDVETGADGTYCFDGLAAGEYRLFTARRSNDPLVLTKSGGDSKFDWISQLSEPVKVGKGEQVKGVDSGYKTMRSDLRAVQLLIDNGAGATDQNTFHVGDVIQIYGSVVAEGNAPEPLGGTLTLPKGLRIVKPVGGLGAHAAVQGQQVSVAYGNKTRLGQIEFLGAEVVVEEAFTGAEIKWETTSFYGDVDPQDNVLTRKIDAVAAAPVGQPEQNHGPAVVDAQFKKTAGLANTGASPVAAGAVGLGALVLGGLALFGARRRRNV